MYPEDVRAKGSIGEMWQVPNGRWLELPRDMLPPSLLVNNKCFYIHEVAELANGTQWIIPLYWIKKNAELCVRCYRTERQGSKV